ncbi:MAG TPA: GatB/YqeY domain-containing protein [Gammaproteobacteria bacterium]|nr:GatB/YqeY domain-containing protein [Gammaproteobacteria bacterium]HRA42735.1 GatB/YqeY domain-containing protein [Gammaproteobacteria bacterium]
MTEESLKNKIQASMIATMRAQDKPKLAVIRLIQAAIKQQEVDERITLDDEQILSTLDKMIRQRRDSIKQFEAASRHDLAEKEIFEIGIIQEYLPTPLSHEEIQTFIQQAIQEVGAASIRDMAKVMNLLKPKLQGRADIGEVGSLIKNQLAS